MFDLENSHHFRTYPSCHEEEECEKLEERREQVVIECCYQGKEET